MRNRLHIYIQSAAAVAVAAVLTVSAAGQSIRGVGNLQKVNDQVYRGAQPTDRGFRELAAAGVKTIVDLREDDERAKDEKKLVKALGMKYVNVPMKGMTTPTDKQISHALKVLKDDGAAPVFIHCKRGADRTGAVMAVYRMEHDNWTNEQALSEARSMGMSWYQLPLIRYVAAYRPHQDHGVLDAADEVADSVKDGAESAVDAVKRMGRSATEIFR